MTDWAAKRFWTRAEAVAEAGGFGILLDGRPVHTPGRVRLVLPTRELADLVAAEWDAQGEIVVPATMPATRMANSAIEKVAPRRAEVADHLTEYGATDLLCYRAEGPAPLVLRQAEEWDPWLDWAAERFGARLRPTTGVVPVAQDPAALGALRRAMDRLSAFELAALHDLVTLPGSLVLGLAAAEGAADPETLWETARIDEAWQIEQWGADDEATRVDRLKRQAFAEAARFRALARTEDGRS